MQSSRGYTPCYKGPFRLYSIFYCTLTNHRSRSARYTGLVYLKLCLVYVSCCSKYLLNKKISFPLSLSYDFILGNSPPQPLTIHFGWKHQWTVLLSVSFHLGHRPLIHAQLHKRTCPPRLPTHYSKPSQHPELLLLGKFCPAFRGNEALENPWSPTSSKCIRSHGNRPGSWLCPGEIKFTQIPW